MTQLPNPVIQGQQALRKIEMIASHMDEDTALPIHPELDYPFRTIAHILDFVRGHRKFGILIDALLNRDGKVGDFGREEALEMWAKPALRMLESVERSVAAYCRRRGHAAPKWIQPIDGLPTYPDCEVGCACGESHRIIEQAIQCPKCRAYLADETNLPIYFWSA